MLSYHEGGTKLDKPVQWGTMGKMKLFIYVALRYTNDTQKDSDHQRNRIPQKNAQHHEQNCARHQPVVEVLRQTVFCEWPEIVNLRFPSKGFHALVSKKKRIAVSQKTAIALPRSVFMNIF